jgi:hypothetical protein
VPVPRDTGKTSGGHTENVAEALAKLEAESRDRRIEHSGYIENRMNIILVPRGFWQKLFCEKLVRLVEDRAIEIWPEFFCSEGASIDQDVG